MENQTRKFLEFNGQIIYFLAANGTYWIAVRPICEALGLDANRQIRELRSDEILSREVSEQTLHDTSGRLQKMVCLTEKFIYGWLFQIKYANTMSEETKANLTTYKLECYHLLWNYFHGTITERQSLLKEKTQVQLQIEMLEKKIKDNDDYKKLQELKKRQKQASTSLNKMDRQIVSTQLDIWRQELPGMDE